MVLHPGVQKRAQAEIDAVIGPNRFPDFEDRPSLPYINAVVKESMRWHFVLPLGRYIFFHHGYYHPDECPKGVPHLATNDDEYNGYYIPKGTLVIANAWSMTRFFLCA